ncbi:putative manganese transporter [Roseospira navarrensis]|nr:putative manganese transporter [Roseospira navarrensis]
MTALIAAATRRVPAVSGGGGLSWPSLPPVGQRALVPVLLLLAALAVPGGPALLLDALSEAYLAVSVFVAGTLLLVGAAERGLGTELGAVLRRNARWQVPIAALLGAFPGCGGAIVALTQFTRGHLSFGGVIATLTATMGDAMFLLLAQAPEVAVLVLGVGVVVGCATGWIVDALHGPEFMRPKASAGSSARPAACATDGGPCASGGTRQPGGLARALERVWLWLLAPGVVIGLAMAFQIEPDAWLAPGLGVHPVFWLGVAGAVGAMALWVLRGRGEVETDGGASAVVDTTSFVTAWVIVAFAGYELAVAGLGLDVAGWFAAAAPVVPLVAVLIGLIPGCGPQILVTSLYLSGAAPLSAQLGNAIANDGDALFPAIAVAPRAAVLATLYSAIPAVLVAYGAYALVG